MVKNSIKTRWNERNRSVAKIA